MTKKLTIGAKAFLFCCAMIEQAHAGYFIITPKAPPSAPPPAVPEFDGAGAIAAIALLASIGAVLLRRSKNS